MHAVKLEGGGPQAVEATRRLTEAGIPVMSHLGLTPQSVHRMGGFKVQGKDPAVAARILPHDEADLALLTDDGTRFRLFASTGDGAPELLCRDDRCFLRNLSQPQVFEAVTGFARGLRSGVSAPVRPT